MTSAIDPTKPSDAVPAVKADLRANLAAAKAEIEALDSPLATVGRLFHVHPDGNDNDSGTESRPKRTVIGAYDALPMQGGAILLHDKIQGGTVVGVNVGGEVVDQGLWLMGSNDSQYASMPAGWRPWKQLELIGVGGRRVTGPSGQSYHCVEMISGSISDRMKPALWLSGAVGGNFTSVNFGGANRAMPACLGFDSADMAGQTGIVGIRFTGCTFPGGFSSHLDQGPCVLLGHGFWNWFEFCIFGAAYYHPLDDDRRAALLHKPGGLAGPVTGVGCAFKIRECEMGNGGLVYYVSSTWALEVQGLGVEGTGGDPVPPAVWIKNPNFAGSGYFQDVWVADAPNPVALQIDDGINEPGGAAHWPNITVVNSAEIRGSCLKLNTIGKAKNPSDQGQVGFYEGIVVAQHEGHQRSFGPAASAYPNLATRTPAEWTGSATVTAGQEAPDGSNNGYRISLGTKSVAYTPRTLAVGDWIVMCGWIKPTSATFSYGGNSAFTLWPLFGPGTASWDITTAAWLTTPNYTQQPTQSWQWVSVVAKYLGVPGTYTLDMRVYADATTGDYLIYPPVGLYHLPASVNRIDATQFAMHCRAVSSDALPGELWTLPGQPVVEPVVPIDITGNSNALRAHIGSNRLVRSNSTSPIIYTLQPNATVNIPVRSVINLQKWGSGGFTVAAGAGVTLLPPGGPFTIATQYAGAMLLHEPLNTWTLFLGGGGSGIASVSADTAPSLGGTLDGNGNVIADYTQPHVAASGTFTLSQTTHGGRPVQLTGVSTVTTINATGFVCEIRNKSGGPRTINKPVTGDLIHEGVRKASISLPDLRSVIVAGDGTDVWVHGALA